MHAIRSRFELLHVCFQLLVEYRSSIALSSDDCAESVSTLLLNCGSEKSLAKMNNQKLNLVNVQLFVVYVRKNNNIAHWAYTISFLLLV